MNKQYSEEGKMAIVCDVCHAETYKQNVKNINLSGVPIDGFILVTVSLKRHWKSVRLCPECQKTTTIEDIKRLC